MAFKPWLRVVTLACGALLSASAWANFPSVPKELYKALNLEQRPRPRNCTKRWSSATRIRARSRPRDPGEILGADPDEHVF